MNTRAGKYVLNLSGEAQYKSFVPAPLPPEPPLELDDELLSLSAKANNQVGILEGRAA